MIIANRVIMVTQRSNSVANVFVINLEPTQKPASVTQSQANVLANLTSKAWSATSVNLATTISHPAKVANLADVTLQVQSQTPATSSTVSVNVDLVLLAKTALNVHLASMEIQKSGARCAIVTETGQ